MYEYIRSVWQCRYFWMSLVRMDLRTRYRGTILGLGWSLLQPLAMTAIICTVFVNLLNVDLAQYAVYLLVGLACWNYMVNSTIAGCHCFHQGESYIRQYPAPLVIYPLRVALGGAFHFLIALCLAVVFSWLIPDRTQPYSGISNVSALPWLVPSFLLIFLFTWSLAILAGFTNVYFQDTKHLVEVGFQLMFYLTPILYKLEIMPAALSQVLRFNPFYVVMELFRRPLIHGVPAPWTHYAYALAAVLVIGAAAAHVMVRGERQLIFHL